MLQLLNEPTVFSTASPYLLGVAFRHRQASPLMIYIFLDAQTFNIKPASKGFSIANWAHIPNHDQSFSYKACKSSE